MVAVSRCRNSGQTPAHTRPEQCGLSKCVSVFSYKLTMFSAWGRFARPFLATRQVASAGNTTRHLACACCKRVADIYFATQRNNLHHAAVLANACSSTQSSSSKFRNQLLPVGGAVRCACTRPEALIISRSKPMVARLCGSMAAATGFMCCCCFWGCLHKRPASLGC